MKINFHPPMPQSSCCSSIVFISSWTKTPLPLNSLKISFFPSPTTASPQNLSSSLPALSVLPSLTMTTWPTLSSTPALLLTSTTTPLPWPIGMLISLNTNLYSRCTMWMTFHQRCKPTLNISKSLPQMTIWSNKSKRGPISWCSMKSIRRKGESWCVNWIIYWIDTDDRSESKKVNAISEI